MTFFARAQSSAPLPRTALSGSPSIFLCTTYLLSLSGAEVLPVLLGDRVGELVELLLENAGDDVPVRGPRDRVAEMLDDRLEERIVLRVVERKAKIAGHLQAKFEVSLNETRLVEDVAPAGLERTALVAGDRFGQELAAVAEGVHAERQAAGAGVFGAFAQSLAHHAHRLRGAEDVVAVHCSDRLDAEMPRRLMVPQRDIVDRAVEHFHSHRGESLEGAVFLLVARHHGDHRLAGAHLACERAQNALRQDAEQRLARGLEQVLAWQPGRAKPRGQEEARFHARVSRCALPVRSASST